jgi:hypothetical protein
MFLVWIRKVIRKQKMSVRVCEAGPYQSSSASSRAWQLLTGPRVDQINGRYQQSLQ